jgi:hypothetical protein
MPSIRSVENTVQNVKLEGPHITVLGERLTAGLPPSSVSMERPTPLTANKVGYGIQQDVADSDRAVQIVVTKTAWLDQALPHQNSCQALMLINAR